MVLLVFMALHFGIETRKDVVLIFAQLVKMIKSLSMRNFACYSLSNLFQLFVLDECGSPIPFSRFEIENFLGHRIFTQVSN